MLKQDIAGKYLHFILEGPLQRVELNVTSPATS